MYIPNPLCAVIEQSGLGMEVHCVGVQPLVSVLFVAVIIILFLPKTFNYLYTVYTVLTYAVMQI